MSNKTITVSIDKLIPNKMNFYESSEMDKIAMASSVRENGLMVPLTVKADSERMGYYIIISGHLRTEGCRLAGLTEVPVIVEDYKNEEEELNALLLGNEYRTKTKFVIAKEMFNRRKLWSKARGERTDLHSSFVGDGKSTRALLAERYKMAEVSVDKYLAILEKRPSLFTEIDEGAMSIETAYQVVRYIDNNELSDLSDTEMQRAVVQKQSPHLMKRVNKLDMPLTMAFNHAAKQIAKERRPKVRKEGEESNSEVSTKKERSKTESKGETYRCETPECPCYDKLVQVVGEVTEEESDKLK